MKSLDEYVKFVSNVKKADETIRYCEEQKVRLEQMKGLLSKNRDKDQVQSTLAGSGSLAQQLGHKIDAIAIQMDNLKGEIVHANEKASLHRESNLALLKGEIDKQKAAISQTIEDLDKEDITRPEIEPEKAIKTLEKIKAQFDKANDKILGFKENEEVLQAESEPIPEIELFNARYEKRSKLWNNRNNFNKQYQKWYMEPFLEQDAEKIVKEVQDLHTQNIQMKMKLKTKQGEKDDVLMQFSQEVQEVQEHSDLIKALGCKDFQDRHWEKIADRMESQIGNMDRRDLTLQKLLDEGALSHAEFIGE